ncbi:MAG: hypothetical protein JW882_13305 [Deltaproteobacteria bacterium]|nr:hypothetical protein [Deltaproteobacteria bacterium]
MFALIFIVIVIALGVFISINLNPETNTWFDYYKGAVGGIFLSGVVLYFVNKIRRNKELKKEKR